QVDAAVATEEKGRNPWTWPLIALVAVLLVALVAVILALIFNPGGDDEPSTSPSDTSSESPSEEPSTSPSSNIGSISIDDGEGMAEEAACAVHDEKGLACTVEEGNCAPDPSEEGKVYALDPQGNVAKGTVIKLMIYKVIPDSTRPSAATGR